MMRQWIVPEWHAPGRVRAFVTTRPVDMKHNRAVVRAHLPSEPRWMRQVHGAGVALLDDLAPGHVPEADAAIASQPGVVAVVLTADCMPVFLCDDDGTRVAVAHAGWRGAAAGVIENTVAAMKCAPGKVMAWLGPAIGPASFEVGGEVRDAFLANDPGAGAAFVPGEQPGKFMADLYLLGRRRLERAGVTRIHGGGFDTFNDTRRFFSYRRGNDGGRMGAFIWLE